jgi:hypothetical protein
MLGSCNCSDATLAGYNKKSCIEFCSNSTGSLNNCLRNWVKPVHQMLRPWQKFITSGTKAASAK